MIINKFNILTIGMWVGVSKCQCEATKSVQVTADVLIILPFSAIKGMQIFTLYCFVGRFKAQKGGNGVALITAAINSSSKVGSFLVKGQSGGQCVQGRLA